MLKKLRARLCESRAVMQPWYKAVITLYSIAPRSWQASQILDRLFLGSSRDALNEKQMKALGITHVVVRARCSIAIVSLVPAPLAWSCG